MNKQQLASRIWASANQMRSKIEANEYKDYILGFIFYKFLSDHEEQFARSQGLDEQGMRDELRETNAEAVSLIQPKLGYFISYENLFSTWIKPRRTVEDEFDASNVRDAISAFNRLIAPSHKKVFVGIFKTLETGLSKLGDSATAQTKAIKSLLNLIRDIPMDGRQDYDVLGFIYEYLISMFAANAGKKAGEFYTPHEVALFMAEIVAAHLKERKTIEIYDPTSGSGSLLINIGRAVTRHLNDPDKIKYYAQELKENTYNLTRMNLVMRGIIPGNIEVRNGDTLERDWPYFDEENPDTTYDPLFVDAVVSNPPYSQHWYPAGRESDPRYTGFGLAPKSKADYAFMLHDLYHLRPDGIMTIVMPHGVLFRGKENDGSEWSIRRALVEGNHVDAIIGLPPNIFFGTSIPTIVVVLRKQRDRDDVLIVDASRGFVKDGKKNKLRACDVKRITDAVTGHLEMPGFSRKVSRDEIRSNGYNLNIPRYIANRETEHWDVRAIMFGGIPACELDELVKYWDVFSGLREALFTTSGNYAMVKVEDIGKAIIDVSSVKEYTATFARALDGLDTLLKTELVDHCLDVTVNTEEEKLTKELFSRVEKLPLIDKYDAYQILDDAWRQTLIDLEIIQTDGFDAVRAVDPNMVLKKNGDKTEEVQDGWVGRIFPFELVQQTFFAEELAEIKAKAKEVDNLLSEVASLASEMPEEEKERVVKDGEEALDAKLVSEVAEEVFNDIETDEISVLRQYLALPSVAEKKSFVLEHPEVEWNCMSAAKNGTYSKGPVLLRIHVIREAFAFPEDSFEALVIKADSLFARIKTLKSTIRSLGWELEKKTIAKIKALTDDEAKTLLEEKWVKPVVRKLMSMPETIVEGLATTIKALAAKYATTLSDVQEKIEEAESKIAEMLGELDGTDDDMAGIAAWKKELAR
ncbi:MAG: type I restriction-modification system subunit M [Lentisphaeraceae bacterium]|nr:type I restriction-modification system subunit M [Lentisphaeraceae bacterium]